MQCDRYPCWLASTVCTKCNLLWLLCAADEHSSRQDPCFRSAQRQDRPHES
jgi:hypothetical protein